MHGPRTEDPAHLALEPARAAGVGQIGRPNSNPRPLKVGVLTFHRCINYGSYWQARCLAEGLRAAGHEAVLLNHRSRAIESRELRCAMQPLLPRRSSRQDIAAYAAKCRAFEDSFAELPLSAPFPLESPDQMERYDLVVVGSDEVWNLTHPWYGGWPIFYGEGLRAGRLAAYAASFGNYDGSPGLEPRWAEYLKQFDAISVRDFNSRRLVGEALGEVPPLVLDPCLQFPPTLPPAPENADYIVVYGHSFDDWLKTAVRRWADHSGLPLLSIGYRNDWADRQVLEAGPGEFAQLMAGSAAVVTNFFHGCVFALLNGRPFACAGTPYRMNKVRDLVRTVGADNHLVAESTPETTLFHLLEAPLDPSIGRNIGLLRNQSATYIDQLAG